MFIYSKFDNNKHMEKDKNLDQEKIIKMPYRNKISDNEINSLFLGLCRIVKQQAIDEAKSLSLEESIKNASLCKEIVKKNREIEMLKMINYQLKKKIDLLLARDLNSNIKKTTANE